MVMALRLATRRSPATTAGRLRHLLAEPAQADPQVTADLRALHAEVLLQCGDLDGALDASVAAAHAAGTLHHRDWPRLITALLISADLAVWAGHPHAVAACDSTLSAFTGLDRPDPDRETVAAALHAVAVFHHTDAGHGYTLLDNLSRTVPQGPIDAMLAAGLAAMRTGPRVGGRPRHGVPPPVPGGVLQPRLDTTTAAYLASRVHARPRHDQAVVS
ncbi:hypothetical protein [Paractinoplanes durhamensis]|uniref:Uncharacterized protein n=1 Tax=Paractinoplanes durhamensis TaxID=113563 RepID=A0ABQ3Z1D4_9ACTN|nr:hypothetical protein [Actinoplanes durhamensis]GIE03389.1 hypothetical protein Adu01nite_47390 [Actinoplanes durhamensis]